MLNTCGTIAPAQEHAEGTKALYGSCTGPMRVPVQIPYITHIMAAQVWYRHRTRTVRGLQTRTAQALCSSCAKMWDIYVPVF